MAECVEHAIVTQANSLDKLMENIKEATDLHLEIESTEDQILIPSPYVSVNYNFQIA